MLKSEMRSLPNEQSNGSQDLSLSFGLGQSSSILVLFWWRYICENMYSCSSPYRVLRVIPIVSKVVNSVSVGVSFFQLERNVSVSECFGVPFRSCTVHIYIYIYIYSTNIIQIQDKLIINYAIQT